MLNLKTILRDAGCKQTALADHLGLSAAAIAQIVNHGEWPKSLDETDLQERICDFLTARGVSHAAIETAFDGATDTTAPSSDELQTPDIKTEEESMLLRKQILLPATRKHFGIFRDPFQDDIESHEDMYVSPDIRYVREAMLATAKHGGLLAVVAESGAGKTTLLRDLEDRIIREHHQVVLVKPYVLAMEDNDQKGKTLKATHIAEALMASVAPLEKVKSSPEARFAQLHKALKESHAAGYKHCLVIDEAHALPVPTLKHLKRFFELEMGFKKLLSIILIGQPELKVKLSERNQDVREVVQRCEMVELAPLNGPRLDEYLEFKFGRHNKPVAEIIDASGVDALRARLTLRANRHERTEDVSLLHPLAVGNLLTAAMNLAADLGVPTVTADVIRGV